MTWEYVIADLALATLQHGQRAVIKGLFDVYSLSADSKKDWNLFPLLFRDELMRIEEQADDKDLRRVQMVVDRHLLND